MPVPARRTIRRPPRVLALLVALIVLSVLAGCGSSSGDANTLLRQTFSGPHTVNSGNLGVSVRITPNGSSTLKSPINLRFGGPFQSYGKGKLPASNFNISLGTSNTPTSIGILTTANSGYVTLQGTSYQLPPATLQQLRSSFAQVTPSGSGSSQSTLSKLGIDPLRWLKNPSVVGKEEVAGAQTTHIRASIDMGALLNDLNTVLGKAASATGNSRVPTSIPSSTRSRIAAQIKSPSFDVWTGTSDKTLRRLTINLNVPISGQLSALLGRGAQIAFNLQYANLNQPQSITAPSSPRPFNEFAPKLRALLTAIQSTVLPGGSAAGGTSGGAGATGSTGGAGATGGAPSSGGGAGSANVQAYSRCIQSAGGSVSKMQSCASLLNRK
jgi:uncharacterized membrane protein YgcG